ncbi:laminin EGF-like protein [Trichuris suis]|nr:laminin EGF-like protein [Trichuris suis]
MANSPRPGLWVLERSTDHGKTYLPWQYFAETPAQCEEFFGPDSLQPIMDDDSVICSTEYSQIIPLGNGQIFITLLNNRPGRGNFSHSDKLQRFTRATNVRIRLLRTKTLQGHLMDLNDKKDPTITRRYFYSIKEIEMGGRCVCHGHAETCDILDPLRPTRLLCRCEHNTCGDQCEQCCPGFKQKPWRPVREGQIFECEPCNCFGHSTECEYDPEVDANQKSLDIHGQYKGGGVCKNCRHNTTGINCETCKPGFFRPTGRKAESVDACIPCACSQPGSVDNVCNRITGQCYCKMNYNGTACERCASGYFNYPKCTFCSCNTAGALPQICNDITGACICKPTHAGNSCDKCSDGYFRFPACEACHCSLDGAFSTSCNIQTGQCQCKPNYTGRKCDHCAAGYYGFPRCLACQCSRYGSLGTTCTDEGQCFCKPGFTGSKCDSCKENFFNYPLCEGRCLPVAYLLNSTGRQTRCSKAMRLRNSKQGVSKQRD